MAKQLLRPFQLDPDTSDTIILINGSKIYFRSRAALEIAKELTGLWPLLYAFVIIPPFIRDFFYSLIARNRYRWFGRRDSCMIPSPEIENRFIT